MADSLPNSGSGARIATAVLAAVLLAAVEARAGDEAAGDIPAAAAEPKPGWRDDPGVRRHPGSYIGGAIGYANLRAWVPENAEHGDLAIGPLHTWMLAFRVGDAFCEWFAVGFRIDISSNTRGEETIGLFDLMLDVSFYPWEGLGLRPSVGLGLGFASGKEEWEFGGGGPGAAALAVLYEIRVTRLFVLAPVVQVVYVGGEEFDAVAIFAGVEILKWFATATG
jgi:hypothetical protein